MFLPKSVKFSVVFMLLFGQACGIWQGAQSQNANSLSATSAAQESKFAVPFSTREPDVYQAEIVLTNYSGAEKSERKIFTARNAAKLRCDYENGISFLQTDRNQSFLINGDRKIYAENQTNSGALNETGNELKDFLTVEWLNEKRGATFEKLGTTDDLTEFRLRLKDAPNANSETLIFIDEKLKIPVRQEFYAANGEQKTLVFSTELRNLRLEADEKLFELPKGLRKVSANEFQKINAARRTQ